MSEFDNSDSALDNIDWNTFRFPPRPPKRWEGTTLGDEGLAPNWASPPRVVRTWHLDLDRLLIIHPVLRKKIDLSRINTRQRLIQLTQLIKKQPTAEDGFALWAALDDACTNAWGISLPETLAVGPERWEWPREEEMGEE